jgi:hypothetical protein
MDGISNQIETMPSSNESVQREGPEVFGQLTQ